MSNVITHLLSPIRFFLANPPKWHGTDDGKAVEEVYEMLFKDLNEKQLKYLATYYMTKVVPELMEGRTSTYRLQFPSPQELQEYLRRINKGQMDKRKEKEQEKMQEAYAENERAKVKYEKEQEQLNNEAQTEAEEFIITTDNDEMQYKARQFRFDMMNQPCEGFAWELSKKWDIVTMVTEIIKAGKLEEFKESMK